MSMTWPRRAYARPRTSRGLSWKSSSTSMQRCDHHVSPMAPRWLFARRRPRRGRQAASRAPAPEAVRHRWRPGPAASVLRSPGRRASGRARGGSAHARRVPGRTRRWRRGSRATRRPGSPRTDPSRREEGGSPHPGRTRGSGPSRVRRRPAPRHRAAAPRRCVGRARGSPCHPGARGPAGSAGTVGRSPDSASHCRARPRRRSSVNR